MVNDFKSGEAVIADGGRGTTETMINDGVPAEWIAPKEGVLSWVCGLAITSNAQNLAAAYKLINYYASAARAGDRRRQGFVAMNPKALPLVSPEYREDRRPADARRPRSRRPSPTRRGALRPGLAGGAAG